jgi:hypothetical protein
MDFEEYRKKYYIDPAPTPKFDFVGLHNAVLFFQEYERAAEYYQAVLGPPAYIEGENTKGWRIGNTWLTLLPAKKGGPKNVEINFVMKSPEEAERLQRAFIEAGGEGPEPSDELMYVPIRYCPVTDPFGTQLLVFCRLGEE